MSKKITILLAAMIVCLSCNAKAFTFNNVRFEIYQSNVSVIVVPLEGGKKYEGEVVIPDQVPFSRITYKVEAIKDSCFKDSKKLTKITLPETLRKIGAYAFKGCTELKELNLPKRVKYIGDGAFENCWNIKKVTLPNKIDEIGDYTFSCCSSIEELTIPKNVKIIFKNAFRDCTNLKKLDMLGVEYIGNFAFSGCRNLEWVSMPICTVHVGKEAFKYCSKIETLYVPVDSIYEQSFNSSTNIKNLYVRKDIKTRSKTKY